jgi:Ser/Thr protein kinase RdoA (MazF antagonist)
MTDSFSQCTYDEQAARLTRTAQAALHSYSLPAATVNLVLYAHNAMFKVITPAGEQYALRLQLPQRRKPLEQTRSELRWLGAIRRDTPLQVPEPVLSDQGYITLQPIEGLEEPGSVVLFRWLEGDLFAQPLAPGQVIEAGRFLGQLHAHSRRFTPPDDFDRPRFDWEGLFGESSVYYPGENRRIFTPEQIATFDAVANSMAPLMGDLMQNRNQFGLIHADFILKNILVTPAGIAAIDFDDCAFGFYLYDLAPLLLQLTDEPHYPELRRAWLAGYSEVYPIARADEDIIECMIAARLLDSCYWIAGNLHNPRIRAQATTILKYRTATLRDFLNTGRVSRRGEQF